MKNLILTFIILFSSLSTQAQVSDLSLQDDLNGTWEADMTHNRNSSFGLELTFADDEVIVTAICEYYSPNAEPVILSAMAPAPVRYRRDGVQITRNSRARIDHGRYFCEAVAGISYHRIRFIDNDTIDMINIDTNKKIRLYRK